MFKDIIKEFREFAMKGSVLDLAVGVVIGGAFGKIIASLVSDIIMPPFSIILGKVDFSNRYISLTGKYYKSLAEAKAAGIPTINYGLFINNVIEFLIVALALFLVIKQVNRFRRKDDPTEKNCPYCFTKIPIKAKKCPNCTSQVGK